MIRLRQSGVDEILIKRVRDWYDPGPGVFIQSLATASFSPSSLFTPGVNGVWYDPSDFTTLFQDAAGTTPVTAVGQPVGRILDKSGRGNHAVNNSGNSANFPVLQQDGTGRYYLAFNGSNQWLQTNSIDFTNTAQMFVSAGVRKLSDSNTGILLETSAAFDTTNGVISVAAPVSSALKYAFTSRGSSSSGVSVTSAAYSAPVTNVVSCVSDLNGSPSDYARLRINGTQIVESTTSQGNGPYGNQPSYIGCRAGNQYFFNGRLYQLVAAGKQASASEITNTETFINQKTGAY